MARLMLNLREFTAIPDQPLPGPNRNKQKDVLSQPVVFRMHGDRNPEMMSFEEEEEVKSDSEDGHLRVESTPWRENDAYRSQWYPTIFSSVASFATSRWERNRSQNSDAIELTDR
ncbi:hypothetical protein H0H93_010899 [Arthromyces matolae]|nr:hypothetical protein H0H93_010899 [Arthromyces matolae]